MKILRVGLVILIMTTAFGLNSARAGQPHMRAALEHLRAARAELKMTEHNKGGWRVRALNHVNAAIDDTENGIRVAR